MVSPIGAVLVLAGGRSRRLGQPKAWVDWHGGPLLLHVVDRLASLADARPFVSARSGQRLPPGAYERVDDRLSDMGPLAGIVSGLEQIATLRGPCRVAVVACDYPFADPRLLSRLAQYDATIVLPAHGDRLHPLHAVWATGAAARCVALLEDGTRRVLDAVAEIDHRAVDAFPSAIDVDRALFNVNDPGDLRAARGEA